MGSGGFAGGGQPRTGGVATLTGAWARPRAAVAEGGSAKARTHVSFCLTLKFPPVAPGRLPRSSRTRTVARLALRAAVTAALILLIVAAEATAMWLLLG